MVPDRHWTTVAIASNLAEPSLPVGTDYAVVQVSVTLNGNVVSRAMLRFSLHLFAELIFERALLSGQRLMYGSSMSSSGV